MKKFFFPFLVAVPLAIIHLTPFIVHAPGWTTTYADFRHLYAAGYMLRSGHAADLYNYEAMRTFQNQHLDKVDGGRVLPFNHLAYEALFFVPLSMLNYRAAFFVLDGLNFILLVLCFRLLGASFKNCALPRWLLYAFPFGFLPSVFAISDGQDSIILLTLAVIAFVLLENGGETEAGAVLALTLFKFQFAIPIAVLYLLWKRWRFVSGFGICGLVLLVLSTLFVGPNNMILYMRQLISMGPGLSTTSQADYGIYPDLMVNLRGFLYAVGSAHASQAALALIWAALSMAILLYAASRPKDFPLAVAVAVLVSYHCFLYDAVLLLIPLSALAAEESLLAVIAESAVLIAPTILFYAGCGFYLMVLPIVALCVMITRKKFHLNWTLAGVKSRYGTANLERKVPMGH